MTIGNKILLSSLFAFAASLLADSTAELDRDLYVQLYQSRVEQTRLEAEQARLDYGLDKWYLDAVTELLAKKFARESEVVVLTERAALSKAKLDKAEEKVKERTALLETVKALRRLGKDVPLFITEPEVKP